MIQSLSSGVALKTVEMHTAGEPIRIVISGYPQIDGKDLQDKVAREKHDNLRTLLMHEPRGHYDMYGAVLVEPDLPGADIAVMFIHNEGYSTMCGHGVIALGRLAVDYGFVEARDPETKVGIQCPCGLVNTFVKYNSVSKRSSWVRFHSVPSFALVIDAEIDTKLHGKVKVDIAYGGAFYALVPGKALDLDIGADSIESIRAEARDLLNAGRAQLTLQQPLQDVESRLYGVIITDGKDAWSEEPTANICVFADAAVDRSPCGSGVTARIAAQHARGQIALGQSRTFQSGVTGMSFNVKVTSTTTCGDLEAITAEVSGMGYYTGEATFVVEEDDPLKKGFLIR